VLSPIGVFNLKPSNFYNYQGTLTLNKVGDYHFFCIYQTPDGHWNTCVDLEPYLTDKDRIADIVVKEKDTKEKLLLMSRHTCNVALIDIYYPSIKLLEDTMKKYKVTLSREE